MAPLIFTVLNLIDMKILKITQFAARVSKLDSCKCLKMIMFD